MQVSRRTALTAAAIGASFVVVAGVLGMSRLDDPVPADSKEPVAATVTDEPRALTQPEPKPVPLHARLLPNLRSLPPEDVSIEIVDGVRRLRFASIIANAGIGPVETLPDGLHPCPAGQRHASQVLYHDADGDGRFDRAVDITTSSRPGGCMLDHPTHDHWHFDAAASYTLTEPGETAPVAVAEKVSFCWRDNRVTPAESRVQLTEHYGDCGRERVQGINPGWADVYRSTLPDQHLDLPAGLPDGIYCLHNEADPLDLLLETDDDDNAAVVPVRITGAAVAVAAGAVRCI